MSRPYSPHAVIRAVPRDLLRAYCVAHQVPLDERVFADGVNPPQAVALASRLSPAIRPRFDGDLREVHELATEDGTLALVAEARECGLDLPPEYHALAGPAARALWFLTHHERVFRTARLLHAADHLSARSSTTVNDLPPGLPPHDTADLKHFRLALTEYYFLEQGRGRLCHIDSVARGHRLLLFLYLDDFVAVHTGFADDDRLERRPHRPTFEVVYQFDHAAGSLSVFAKGGQSVRITLLDLFCRHMLGVERPSGVALRPRYRLDHLLSRDTTVPLDPAGGVTGARIRRLRVAVPRRKEAVTLDAAPEGGGEDIYRMLDRHFPPAEFPRDELLVTTATITVGYTAGGKGRTLTFDVTSRGATNLTSRSDDQQDVGERVLRAWGVIDA